MDYSGGPNIIRRVLKARIFTGSEVTVEERPEM